MKNSIVITTLICFLGAMAHGQRLQHKSAITNNQMTKPMDTSKLTNEVVKAAFDALQKGDKQAWADLFAPGAGFYDDGNKRDLAAFNKNSVGKERFTSIDKVENNGTALYGNFHSDQWGDFKTFFKFTIDSGGKISKLEIGQASY